MKSIFNHPLKPSFDLVIDDNHFTKRIEEL